MVDAIIVNGEELWSEVGLDPGSEQEYTFRVMFLHIREMDENELVFARSKFGSSESILYIEPPVAELENYYIVTSVCSRLAVNG